LQFNNTLFNLFPFTQEAGKKNGSWNTIS